LFFDADVLSQSEIAPGAFTHNVGNICPDLDGQFMDDVRGSRGGISRNSRHFSIRVDAGGDVGKIEFGRVVNRYNRRLV